MGKFVVKSTPTGTVFHLVAANGETIATSEVYSSVEACKHGVESVKHNAKVHVEDQTVEGFTPMTCPKFEIYLDKRGEFRFRLVASNGQNIAASEGYTRRASCKNGIESVGANAPDAPIEEQL